jgi:hypothetical protein
MVWKFRHRVLTGTSNLSIFQNVHTGIGSYPASYSIGTKTSFSEGKAIAEIRNEWRYVQPQSKQVFYINKGLEYGTALDFY